MKRVLLLLIALMLAATAALGLYFWRSYEQFLQTPLQVAEEGYSLNLAKGTPYVGMVQVLQQAGLTQDSWPWRLLQRLHPREIKAGEYRIEAGTLPQQWLDRLEQGDVIRYQFTIVEGWSFRQLQQALGKAADLVDNVGGLQPQEVMAQLGYPEQHPEGMFLPETYQFTRGDTTLELLARANNAMDQVLQSEWQNRAQDLPLENAYELLILASIIEKETGLPQERQEIAGVFVRRLRQGMRLQTDPTVIYGLGESFDGDIRSRDLVTDTPYNTYTRGGLPPTPIAMAGQAAIHAAANPKPGKSLYFVATGDGGHYFSETLREHNQAVNKYQRKRN